MQVWLTIQGRVSFTNDAKVRRYRDYFVLLLLFFSLNKNTKEIILAPKSGFLSQSFDCVFEVAEGQCLVAPMLSQLKK